MSQVAKNVAVRALVQILQGLELATVAIGVCRVHRNGGRAGTAKEEGGLRANRHPGCNGLSARDGGMAPDVPHGDRSTCVNEEVRNAMRRRKTKRKKGDGDSPAVASEQGRWRMVQ